MGNMQAEALAEAAKDGTASLRQALAVHLTSNHWPPLPPEYVDVAVEAIELAEEAAFSEMIDLPAVKILPSSAEEGDDGVIRCRVSDLLNAMHLWSFLGEEGE